MNENKIKELKELINSQKIDLQRNKTLFESLETQLSETESQIVDLQDTSAVLDRVTVLLNSIGEEKQLQAQQKIEGIVTKGLQFIFGDNYSFHITQTVKGKNSTIDFTIKSLIGDSVLETDILGAHGGGLASVVGFLLRITLLLLSKDSQARIIIGDEMFAAVSREYLDPLAQFVKELVEKTGIQFLLITHSPEWIEYADVAYRFENKNGVTKVREED